MTLQELTLQRPAPGTPGVRLVRPSHLVAAALALIVMVAVIVSENVWFLNFLHVMAGVLWTGIDLFLGFVLGPILRRLPLEAKRMVLTALVPRTLILMPVLSILTATTGWFLAKQLGFLDLVYPEYLWIVASLVIVTILSVQGLGMLLPTNVRMFYEVQRPKIDDEKVSRWMRRYVRVVASQGALQVAIIVVMSRLAIGV
jgi:hypothetical protein